ncbi:MAG: hypothetical protein NC293_13980 [Roseburia sp.]|nr:hypothetical protein [Roseburia sp.]
MITLTPDTENSAKAKIVANKVGVETISVEVTTTKEKTATIKKAITVTAEAVVVEDVTLEFTANNTVTIEAGKGAYGGGGTLDISKLIKDVDLANYKSITVYGTAKHDGADIEGNGKAMIKILKGSDWSNDAVITKYNTTQSGMQEGVECTTDSLATALSGVSTLSLLFQNCEATTGTGMVFTVTKVVLNAK